MNKKKYYITTAIAYTSSKPHIGNVYELIATDALARFKREEGYDVFFQTGSDDHGQKIADKAAQNNQTPQQYTDEVSQIIKKQFDIMNVSYDKFIRTTDPNHMEQVSAAFKYLYEKGDIYKGFYEGNYCVACESFFTNSQLDENGCCPDCHREISKEKEECYFFNLKKYEQKLKDFIMENPDWIIPISRKNEMVTNFLNPGLSDLAISRTSFDWGVHTFDPKHVVYVWLDALLNYITGIGWKMNGEHEANFYKYWPADVHVIGKDIVRFHSIYWPIFLMALDIPLPKKIFGHPWLLVGDSKMSKSTGNVLYADELVEVFGCDALRYTMLKEIPFDRDGHLTKNSIIDTINNDLVNVLGNLVKRSLAMVTKYNNNHLQVSNTCFNEFDQDLIKVSRETYPKVKQLMNEFKIADSLDEIINLARRCNKYIDESEPWVLAKDTNKKQQLDAVLYNLCESIRIIAVLLKSFIPETADNILQQLNTKQTTLSSITNYGNLEKDLLINPTNIPLFNRLDVEETLAKLNPVPQKEIKHKEEINIDDFNKLELRKGTIIECKNHPNANKLLISKIDLGYKVIQVVSGIANCYKPEELIGQSVLVCVNLKPAKLRNELSEGMILCCSNDDGNLKIINVNGENGDLIN